MAVKKLSLFINPVTNTNLLQRCIKMPNHSICHEVDTRHKISIYGMPIIGMPGDNNWVMLITGSLHYHSASKCSVYPFIVILTVDCFSRLTSS